MPVLSGVMLRHEYPPDTAGICLQFHRGLSLAFTGNRADQEPYGQTHGNEEQNQHGSYGMVQSSFMLHDKLEDTQPQFYEHFRSHIPAALAAVVNNLGLGGE